LLVQVATGLVSDDEITTSGPLTSYVSGAVVSAATTYHTEVGIFVLIGLVVLHIGAIIFYRLKKREDLVRPMIRGDRVTQVAVEGSCDDNRSRSFAAVVFLACAALVAGVLTLAG
jgi:cytochrome b